MSLAAGERFAHSEIVAKIGEGGMGEVYRARDSRLGRDVAIKILAERIAAEARLRAAPAGDRASTPAGLPLEAAKAVTGAPQFVVVFDWLDELERQVPD